ncbi:MAG: rhodanese-like domain-containing protein [Candidatus Zixiibacteriota bacterium]|nr:MAG: rhodanese-like domain-containing protein [candidate division Zixibacteria bacterium]
MENLFLQNRIGPARIHRITVLLLVGLLLTACGHKAEKTTVTRKTPAQVREITVQQLRDLAASQDIYLLDVRTMPEFLEAHLAFADDLIPFDSLYTHQDRLPSDKTQPVYCFCRSGRRSGIAAQVLRKMGYTTVYNVTGGILAWKKAGFPTVSGPPPAR